MAHRIRETLAVTGDRFSGPVEVDETYISGKERNKHNAKKLRAGRGPVGKTAVVGMKDRETGQIASLVVEHTDAPTLQGFVERNTEPDATVYTDDARAYRGMLRHHEAVKHSVSEYVRGMAHTNGLESHWAALKRGYDGVPSTLGTFLRSFRWGHVRQLDRVSRQLLARAWAAGAGPGTERGRLRGDRPARPSGWATKSRLWPLCYQTQTPVHPQYCTKGAERSGLFCGGIYWVLLVSGRFSVPKPLSQIQRSTL